MLMQKHTYVYTEKNVLELIKICHYTNMKLLKQANVEHVSLQQHLKLSPSLLHADIGITERSPSDLMQMHRYTVFPGIPVIMTN